MKSTAISIIIVAVLIGGVIVLARGGTDAIGIAANNVSVIDGKQIIEIKAKGGYQPRKSTAKSGMPTVLRFSTEGTFDCASIVRIPSMDITKNLPQSGITDIPVGIAKAGTLYGTCGMGMYPFEVDFRS